MKTIKLAISSGRSGFRFSCILNGIDTFFNYVPSWNDQRCKNHAFGFTINTKDKSLAYGHYDALNLVDTFPTLHIEVNKH